MKTPSFLAFFLFVFGSTQAMTLPVNEPPLKAYSILLPVGHTGKSISRMDLSTISIKDVESLSGKKLSFFQRVGFRLCQRKLRREMSTEGTLKKKTWQQYTGNLTGDGSGFHAGGFFLGLLLNFYAIPIVYLIKDKNRTRRIKWMWIGLGTLIALLTLLILVVGSGLG